MKETLLSALNPEQQKGVLETDGAVLVLAGAGSGKTRLLVYKIAYLIKELGISPEVIFATTFTNKAAGEMKMRAEELVGRDIEGLWIGTFHSLCGRILRQTAEAVGLKRNFTIFDEQDSLRLTKEAMSSLEISTDEVKPQGVVNFISKLKERLITPQEFASRASSEYEKLILRIYERYQELLESSNGVDFDDMIMKVVMLLKRERARLIYWSGKFEYILVDEFQDTNRAQYELVKLLATVHRNITVVGDDDQSIYGWRGAEIRNILDFPNDFKQTKIIRLEQNYRSTQRILAVANSVIANNTMRYPKKLWSASLNGKKPLLACLYNEYDEARWVAEKIDELIAQEGLSYSDIAVLYRTNAQSRVFEEVFRRCGIPYVIVGAVGFYQRAEIKDILAYLRLLVNSQDNLAFKRAISVPRRGVGRVTMRRLEKKAEAENRSLYDSALSFKHRGVEGFCALIEELKGRIASDTVYELLLEVVEKSGYRKMLEDSKEASAEERLMNLDELISSAYDFARRSPGNPTLEAYLSEISLLTSVDLWNEHSGRVNIMTSHSAKGLEFRAVFVCGLEQSLFPLAKALGDAELLEEERRLFYVSITRCKEHLFLSSARYRRRWGEESQAKPSIFIEEIPAELVERVAVEDEAGKIVGLNLNATVWHPRFGRGKIIEIRGFGKSPIVTVLFERYGIKKIDLAYIELEILGY